MFKHISRVSSLLLDLLLRHRHIPICCSPKAKISTAFRFLQGLDWFTSKGYSSQDLPPFLAPIYDKHARLIAFLFGAANCVQERLQVKLVARKRPSRHGAQSFVRD